MAFVTRKYALDTMRKNGVKFWRLYDGDSKTCIGEMQDSTTEIDVSLSNLNEAFESISEGWVTLVAGAKSTKQLAQGGDTKSNTYTFKISMSQVKPQQQNTNGQNNTGINFVHELYKVKAEMLKQQHDFEMERFKMKHGKEKDTTGKFLDKIATIIELEYMKYNNAGAISGPEKSISPAPVKRNTEETINGSQHSDVANKVTEALQDLSTVDENFADNLVKLAKFAKENPLIYNEYLKQL